MNRVDVVELVVDLVDVDLDVALLTLTLTLTLLTLTLTLSLFVDVALRAASILKNHDFENLEIEFGCFR